jgi:hypothetical protein
MGFKFGNAIASVQQEAGPHTLACLKRLGLAVHDQVGTVSTIIQNGAFVASGVTAGTYPYATITVDVFGRVTSASAGVPGLAGSGADDLVAVWSSGGLTTRSLSDDGLIVVSAAPFRVKYDGTNYLTVTPGGTGTMTYDASGASPTHVFVDRVKVTNDSATNFEVRRTTGGSGTYGVGLAVASGGGVRLDLTNDAASTGLIIAPASNYTGQPILDITNELGTSRVQVMYDGVTTFAASPVIPTVAVGTNNTQAASTAFVQTGFYSADGTAQTLSAMKTITPVTGAWFKLKRANSTSATDAVLEITDSAGAAKVKFGLGTGTGRRSWVCYAADGTTERSWVTNVGTLVAFDGTASGAVGVPSSTAPLTWAGTQTYSAAVTFNDPVSHNDIDTFGAGATFQTVAPTSSIGFTFSTVAPTFNNVNPTFATTADGVFQGFEWPVSNPATMKVRAGVRPTLFTPTLDNIFAISYNINGGTRDDTGQHSFIKQTEFDFFDGTNHNVEDFFSYTTAGGTSWRPQAFGLNTTTGRATWEYKPNNDNSGNNRSLELIFPHVAFNRDTAAGNYAGNGCSFFFYAKDYSASGSMMGALSAEVLFDQSTDFTGSENAAFVARLDFSPTSRTTGYTYGCVVPTPIAPGSGSTVAGFIGVRVLNARIDLLTDGQALQIDSQTVSNADQGNLKMSGVGYNHGHYVTGGWHLWDENSGGATLRAKYGAPTSDGDGNAIMFVQTGLAAFTQTYATASHTHSNPTSATLTDSTGGSANTTLVDVTTAALADPAKCNDNFADLAAQVNALRVDLLNAKQVLNAAIDDGQLSGVFA